MPKTKILLIEDNKLLREGIAGMLNGHGDFKVVAKVEDGQAVGRLQLGNNVPDVALLDLGLEKTQTAQLMAFLRKEWPDVRIIAMDILPEQVDIVEFVKAGGSGFILKSASLREYVKTIKAVVGGEKVLPPVLTASLFMQIVESALDSDRGIPESSIELTRREQEVVDLISEGLSNKEIAARLHIATHTVKSHVHNTLEKLMLGSRLEIAALVHRKKSG